MIGADPGTIPIEQPTAVQVAVNMRTARALGVQIPPSILARAMGFAKLHLLRAYDAVQLATAVELHGRRRSLNLSLPTFLSADQRLIQGHRRPRLDVDIVHELFGPGKIDSHCG